MGKRVCYHDRTVELRMYVTCSREMNKMTGRCPMHLAAGIENVEKKGGKC